VGEIVVTANKREQKMNDVGLTVTVVTGQSLKAQQINTLADLANSIPGLSFSNTANGTPVYTLRGVGFSESSLAAYPTVSVYTDEVALPFGALTRHSAFDLERVEVLKGPQGTLFGQNATGGAINYITAKPTKDMQAGIDLSYGRFNEITAEGFISGPIGQGLSVRVAGRTEHADGWQRSYSRDDRNGKVENYMGRILVAYDNDGPLRLLLNLNGWKDKSQTQAPQYIASNVQNPVTDPVFDAAGFSPQTPRDADWTPNGTNANNRMLQSSLRADLDITDSVTLTSLTSYIDYKQRQSDDGDGLASQNLDLPGDFGRIKSFSQELRLSNGGGAGIRWVLGANYERSRVNQDAVLRYDTSSSGATLGTLGYPIHGSQYYSHQKMTNYAFFGNVEYDVTPELTVRGGIRYTKAKTSAKSCNFYDGNEPGNVGQFFYDVLQGGKYGPYVNGACFQINDQATTIGGVAPGESGLYVDTLKQDNVSWKVGVDYKPSPGFLIYANVAKGYKAGSFPTVSSSTYVSYLPVSQESVLSYEAGFKATLLDRTLQFNAAGFYYDYKDKQLRSKVLQLPFGILDILQNIPKSAIKGFEIELSARPTRGLTSNVAFTYLDANIKQFVGINAAGVDSDFSGSRMPFTPKYQVSWTTDYEFAVSDTMNAFMGATVNARSDTVSVIGGDFNPPTANPQTPGLFRIKSYETVDARLGIKSEDDKWRFTLWGKNIFNTYYWNNVVAGFDTIVRFTGRPATYGASVGFKF
ncbi:MAG: TonB-dependent receptor, partial [Novosphingobium sp.]